MPRHQSDSELTSSQLERRNYYRQWREANKEKDRAYHKVYYAIHKEHLLGLNKEDYARNPEPKREYAKRYRRANAKYLKGWHREHGTGCSPELYAELLAKQNGVCAICGGTDATRELAADHDHETGRVRGLLCTCCNTAIGKLRHDAGLVRQAAKYLERSG